MARILLLSPYHGGSHRAFAEGLAAASRHELTILSLPARFWKWRMRGAALLLAAVGIYGVMAFTTAERRHEIGIRMALGARRDHLLGMVIGQGLLKVLVGIGIGLPLAAVLGIGFRSQLFGVPAIDPVTFILAPIFLSLIAVLATWAPAWRTTRVNPVEALQQK